MGISREEKYITLGILVVFLVEMPYLVAAHIAALCGVI